MGVNRTYLSKLETGASYPGLELIAKLATVLEVELLERIEAELPTRREGRPSGGSESVPPLVRQLLTRRSANMR